MLPLVFQQRAMDRRDFLKKLLTGTAGVALSPFLLAGGKKGSAFATETPTQPQMNLVDFYANPLHLGAGFVNPELIDLVCTMFTPEEAMVAQHLWLIAGKTAAAVAAEVNMPVADVRTILNRLGDSKRVIFVYGKGEPLEMLLHLDYRSGTASYPWDNLTEPRRYSLFPLQPGTHDLTMVNIEGTNAFRSLVATKWEAWLKTDAIGHSLGNRMYIGRYIPIQSTIKSDVLALPSDKLADMVGKAANKWSLANCLCRSSKIFAGGSCSSVSSGMPLEVCLQTGVYADYFVGRGMARYVSKSEALDAKLKAQEYGGVSLAWADLNEYQSNIICSCCKDCCYYFRAINQHKIPGVTVRPNYYPKLKPFSNCNNCSAPCVSACPVDGVITWKRDLFSNYYASIDKSRCIGCGHCVVKCSKSILSNHPVLMPKLPPLNYAGLALQAGPGLLGSLVDNLFHGQYG